MLNAFICHLSYQSRNNIQTYKLKFPGNIYEWWLIINPPLFKYLKNVSFDLGITESAGDHECRRDFGVDQSGGLTDADKHFHSYSHAACMA